MRLDDITKGMSTYRGEERHKGRGPGVIQNLRSAGQRGGESGEGKPSEESVPRRRE